MVRRNRAEEIAQKVVMALRFMSVLRLTRKIQASRNFSVSAERSRAPAARADSNPNSTEPRLAELIVQR